MSEDRCDGIVGESFGAKRTFVRLKPKGLSRGAAGLEYRQEQDGGVHLPHGVLAPDPHGRRRRSPPPASQHPLYAPARQPPLRLRLRHRRSARAGLPRRHLAAT